VAAHEIKISAQGGRISCNPGQREGFCSIENKKISYEYEQEQTNI
jgi:hypothetical protein